MEYKNTRQDLAMIIAQETAGFIGAVPEQDDYDLADELIKFINKRNED